MTAEENMQRKVPSHETAIEHGRTPAEAYSAGELLLCRGHACSYAVVHDAPYAHQLQKNTDTRVSSRLRAGCGEHAAGASRRRLRIPDGA